MSKQLEIELTAVPSNSKYYTPVCYYAINKMQDKLLDHIIKINWDQKRKAFDVHLSGSLGGYFLDDVAHTIPLEVARSSKCSCGSSLNLGNYSVVSEDGDFTFQGEFFCPACKAKHTARKHGIGGFIRRCIRDLKKIEIKATGISLERENSSNKPDAGDGK